MKRAAIAIGSNSTRLLCADSREGQLTDLLRGREETRLFLGLDGEGNIEPRRLEETARAVERLWNRARAYGAETVELFATSASRDAKNGAQLRDRIRALCGLDMRIISGREEAALAFRAVSAGERRLVMDIGGGSTEWIIGENNRVEWSASMQLGASRLLKMQPIDSPADAERVLALARGIMAPCAEQLRRLPPAPAMVGLGGSCTTAAAICMGREAHGEQVEGRTVTLEQARAQLHLLSRLPLEQRALVPGLPPARAVHMPHGLCILISALESCGFDALTVSGKTNLDGYLMSLEDEQKSAGSARQQTTDGRNRLCPGN